MDEGVSREVRLRCKPPDAFQFEIQTGDETSIVPIDPISLRQAVAGGDVRIDAPTYHVHFSPLENAVALCFQVQVTVQFSLPRNQFEVLARNLGLQPT